MADTELDAYEAQLRAPDGAGGLGAYLAHRAKPHAPPWLTVIVTGVVSIPAHLFWDDNAAATAGLTLASVALTGVTWWAGKATTAQRRLHSAITVACGTGWLTAASIAGPGAGPLPSLYAIGGGGLALSWNIRQILRRNPDSLGAGAGGGLLEKVGLAKTLVTSSDVQPNKATFNLQLPRGELTHDDVTKALPKLASALDVAPNAVRAMGDPDSASRAQITVVPHDLLKNTTPVPGPSSPGGSIADAVVTGIYEDGTPCVLFFPGDSTQSRNAMHLLIMGMTGSGKSEGGLTALAEILTRRDVVVWASDPAKADQTLGPLLPAIDWAALDIKSTAAMLEALKAAIPARTRWLAKYGYKQWEPACAKTQADGAPGMPYLIGWFEEAAKTLREIDEDAFTGIAQEARSAGVSLVVSMQRASGTQVSTDTRASLGSSWCFGVRSEIDAGFALPGEVLDAGAAPHTWKDKKPGYAYLVANGIPETFWATPPALTSPAANTSTGSSSPSPPPAPHSTRSPRRPPPPRPESSSPTAPATPYPAPPPPPPTRIRSWTWTTTPATTSTTTTRPTTDSTTRTWTTSTPRSNCPASPTSCSSRAGRRPSRGPTSPPSRPAR